MARRREKLMVFRVDAAERAAIHKAADAINVNLSEFCRSVLLRAIGIDRLAELEIPSGEENTNGEKRKNKRRIVTVADKHNSPGKWSDGG